MTHSMKVISAVILLLAIVVGVGAYSMHTLDTSSKILNEHIMEMEKNTNTSNWAKAKEDYKTLEENWTKNKSTWSVLLDHIEIDNIDSTMTRISKFIETKNSSMALAEIATLKLYVEHIPDKESFNLKNIF